jgi:hypothetical protein
MQKDLIRLKKSVCLNLYLQSGQDQKVLYYLYQALQNSGQKPDQLLRITQSEF